jgi:aspartate aminotransferase/aminotransferase
MSQPARRNEPAPAPELRLFSPTGKPRAPAFSAVVDDVGEAMSIKYNTMVYELRRQGRQVITMSLGEAYFDLPLYSFDDLPFPDVYHYSHSRGLPELREKLSDYFLQQYQVPIDPETEILVTAGSKAAIYQTLLAILNPGDEVLIPEPAWVSYTEQVKLCYGTPVSIPHPASVEDFARYITPRTRAIIVTTPHNPRGYVYSERELRWLLELARRHGLWLLSDEAYSDFVADDSFVSLGRLDPHKTNSVVFNSISKNYGISGWRLGYVIAKPDLVYRVLKINQHLITCPATILSHYVARHFDEILTITKPQIQKLLAERASLAEFMSDIGLTALPGNAAFYFFVSIAPSPLTSEEFATRLLQEHAISVVPGIGYGTSCDKFIRVSFGTASMDENRHGLHCIKSLIEATAKQHAA